MVEAQEHRKETQELQVDRVVEDLNFILLRLPMGEVGFFFLDFKEILEDLLAIFLQQIKPVAAAVLLPRGVDLDPD